MILAVLYCLVEVCLRGCKVGAFDKYKFLCRSRYALFYCRNIIGRTIGKGFFFKMTAAESVTVGEYYQGVESYRFKAGGVKYRKVKAGALLLL